MFCAIFSNDKWWPSWNANLQKIKTPSHKKHSGTKLDQYQPMVLGILSFSCLYAIFSNGPCLPSWIVNLHKFEIHVVPFKKIKIASCKKHLAQSWINFNQWFLRYCHFLVYAISSNSHWWRSWIVNFHKYETVPFWDHCDRI